MHIKCEKKYLYSVLLQYLKGLGHEIDYKKFDKNARSWPKNGRRHVFFLIFQSLIERKIKIPCSMCYAKRTPLVYVYV
jgi:hypothetical protein